jgi:hypothetical protein
MVVLLARRMDSAEVDTEWGPGGSTVIDVDAEFSWQLEFMMKSRSELLFPGKGRDGKMMVQYLDL